MYTHTPVLLEETMQFLEPGPGKRFIDATLGAGGHTREILERTVPDGKVLAIDQDESALAGAVVGTLLFPKERATNSLARARSPNHHQTRPVPHYPYPPSHRRHRHYCAGRQLLFSRDEVAWPLRLFGPALVPLSVCLAVATS